MKKSNYIQAEIELVDISTSDIICTSNTESLSKGSSLFGDEEDD